MVDIFVTVFWRNGEKMKKLTRILALMILCTGSVMATPLKEFAGTWDNTDSNTRGLTKVHISAIGRNLQVQAWGKAHPHDSDLGRRIATAYTPSVGVNAMVNTSALVVDYDNSFSKRMVVIKQRGSKHIVVEEFVKFTDQSNRSSYTNTYTFKKRTFPLIPANLQNDYHTIPVQPVEPVRPHGGYAHRPVEAVQPQGMNHHRPIHPGMIPVFQKEDKISFDWKNLRIKKISNRWKIMEGTSHMMMDFGSSLREASKALGIIQRYRMNEMCFVGRPDPSMTYFLVDGKAPVGPMANEDSIAFDPSKLAVRKVGERWKIMEGTSHMMMDFGANELEARNALALIIKYEFTHMCYVGRPNPSMTYFRK